MQVESHILDRPDRHQGCPAPSSSTNIWAMSKSSTTRVWREMWPLSRRISSTHKPPRYLAPAGSTFATRHCSGSQAWTAGFKATAKVEAISRESPTASEQDHRKDYKRVQ